MDRVTSAGHLRVYVVGHDGLLPPRGVVSTGVTPGFVLPGSRTTAGGITQPEVYGRRRAAERLLRREVARARAAGRDAPLAVVLVRCPAGAGGNAAHESEPYSGSFAVRAYGRTVVLDVLAPTLDRMEQKVQDRIADLRGTRAWTG